MVNKMFHINSIDIDNFGPYKDHVKVNFSTKNGVTLVWGNNGKGKTSLIRAIKYVLYNDIPEYANESSKSIFINTNIEAREDHNYGFSVKLDFSDEGDNYELTRSCKPQGDDVVPEYNNCYENTTFLRKNGKFQTPAETEHILSSLMPKGVSRFFVFDGELLKEYEELLIDGNEADKIKQSIENILGLPIISNSARDIANIENDYNNKVAKEAKKHEKTKKIGEEIDRYNSDLQQQNKDLKEVNLEIEKLEKEKSELDAESKKNSKYHEWIQQIKSKEEIVKTHNDDIKEKIEQIKLITNDIWKSICNPKIIDALNSAKEEIKKLEDEKNNNVVTSEILSYMKEAYHTGECSICGSSKFSLETKEKLSTKIKEYENKIKVITPEDEKRLDYLKSIVVPKLTNKQFESKKDTLELLESQIDELKIKKTNLLDAIKDIRKNVNNYEEAVKSDDEIVNKLVNNKESMKIQKEARDKINKTISELQEKINECKAQIKKLPGNSKDFEILQKQSEFCHNLSSLFESGIAEFRKQILFRLCSQKG